jgi:hypothetical protein
MICMCDEVGLRRDRVGAVQPIAGVLVGTKNGGPTSALPASLATSASSKTQPLHPGQAEPFSKALLVCPRVSAKQNNSKTLHLLSRATKS